MNWEEFDKEIMLLKKKKSEKIRQNHLFEKDTYMKFKNIVGDGNVSEGLNKLIKAYLKFKKII